MGLNVEIEKDGLGAVFTYTGIVNGDDAYRESKALYTPERLKKLKYQIADLRQVSRIEVSPKAIQNLAELDKNAAKEANGFFIASIVDHDLQESLSQFYRAYANDPFITANIFRSIEPAREWIEAMLAESNAKVSETIV